MSAIRKRVIFASASLGLLWAILLGPTRPAPAVGAEPEFVGMLALAVQPEVARELGLSEEQLQRLRTLIAYREDDPELLELVLEAEDLPAIERAARLRPFRAASERMGLALLRPEQARQLKQLRLRREGLVSLAEPEVAEQLKLTEQQEAEVAKVLAERDERVRGADEATIRFVKEETRQKLAAVLTATQQAAWKDLIGPAGPGPETSPPEDQADSISPPATPEPSPPDAGSELAGSSEAQPEPPGETPPDGNVDDQALAELVEQAEADLGPEQSPGPPEETGRPQPDAEPGQTPQTPGTLRFKFRYHPWKDVIDWFVEQADLSLVTENYPTGTFNYVDEREYTPTEALDVLNSVLLTKGYTLVRRRRALMLIHLEDGIPPNLVDTISPEELDERGEYELVRVLFDLEKLSPEEAEAEVSKLIGPQGEVIGLPNSRQLLVTETGGRLRAIRAMIQRIEDPEGLGDRPLRVFRLEFATLQEALEIIRQLLEIPEDEYATSDGSLRLAADLWGGRLLVSGEKEKLSQLEEIIKAIDVPGPESLQAGGIDQPPQLEVYSITTADPEAVLAVMQTLLAGVPNVRLAIDPKTGNLVALARPSDQATIRATLDQMQQDARQVEVIPLRTVEPQLAVLSINKLFGAGGEEPDPNAPQVDADPTTRQLLVRATPPQLEQIRELLKKMGEGDANGAGGVSGGNVRMLPLTGAAAQSALERIQQIWPSMHSNPIRVVTPSAVIPTLRPGRSPESANPGTPPGEIPRSPPIRAPLPSPLIRPGDVPASPTRENPAGAPEGKTTKVHRGARVFLVSQPLAEETVPAPPPAPPPPPDEAAEAPREQPADEAAPALSPPGDAAAPSPADSPTAEPEEAESAAAEPSVPAEPPVPSPGAAPSPGAGSPPEAPPSSDAGPSPIIVAPGPGGVMIASGDLKALDAFEELLTALAGNLTGVGPEITIFYLKHAKAALVAQTLDAIFGGGTLTSGDDNSGGGGLVGDLASAALGDAGGGMLGALLGVGSGGTITPSGVLRITPDARLNALIVQANPADIQTIEQLLQILDQKESPEEILATPKARMIPVFNTQAEEIAEIVREVYQDRLVTGGSNGGGRRPSPEDFIRMLRGGRGSRGSGGTQAEDLQKMSVGVDRRTNSLVVAAPDQLFQEVRQLVEQLDQAAVETQQATRVITLRKASPEAVQRALASMMGDAVQFGSGGGSSGRQSSSGRTSSSRGSSSSGDRDARRAMFFEMMRQRFQGGGPPGGGSRGGSSRFGRGR